MRAALSICNLICHLDSTPCFVDTVEPPREEGNVKIIDPRLERSLFKKRKSLIYDMTCFTLQGGRSRVWMRVMAA